jgi:TorA maturation chaperone TorD
MNRPLSETSSERGQDPAAMAMEEEQAYRSGLYSILGALLRDSPGQSLLDYIAALNEGRKGERSELALALDMLALAARHSDPTALRDEYHALFIGLGRGELVPYGSWYQTGFLMEKPLGLLRADLAVLGFEREENVHEPEDHIAALCEVMAMLITEQAPLDQQRRFFDRHIGNWAPAFFADLEGARSAVLYRSVARLGRAIMSLEARYLSLLD